MPSSDELRALHEAYYPATEESDRSVMCSTDQSSKNLARWLSTRFAGQNRLVDLGSGTGALAAELQSLGFPQVSCCEPSEVAADGARSRGLSVVSSLGELPGATVDVVTAIEVIEHLADPLIVLRQVRAILKPGGHIFLTTPNVNGLRARLDGPSWREAQHPFHVVLFSWRALCTVLEQAGFRDVTYVRFSPATGRGLRNALWTRGTQALGLYGGLRVTARV